MPKLSTIEVLRAVNDGGALEDLNHAIDEVVSAVQARGGTGKVTLELTITRNGERMVNVVDAVKSSAPKKVNPTTGFYISRDGGLSRRDDEQFEMPFASGEAR